MSLSYGNVAHTLEYCLFVPRMSILAQQGIRNVDRVRPRCLPALSARRRSDSVYGAVWWKSGMLIQEQGCFAARKHTAETCLSAPAVITLNQPTQSQMFLHMFILS